MFQFGPPHVHLVEHDRAERAEMFARRRQLARLLNRHLQVPHLENYYKLVPRSLVRCCKAAENFY